MRNGMVSELPPQGHLISDLGFSSSLGKVSVPTPTATDVAFDKPGLSRKITKESSNRGVGLALWAHRIDDGFYELLRTPAASEAERGHQPEDKARARGGQVTLSGQINFERDRFNRFEPAVKRWEEVTGMKAPNPTKPDGKDGGQRLSSEFTEWMMGLKPGWVTGHGLSRKDELKACGNGVVPQQAKLALGILLERVTNG
tara:strand:- start:699 stop:1298 length:600 start_codon:yes stop_codon:yes gene_type:complete